MERRINSQMLTKASQRPIFKNKKVKAHPPVPLTKGVIYQNGLLARWPVAWCQFLFLVSGSFEWMNESTIFLIPTTNKVSSWHASSFPGHGTRLWVHEIVRQMGGGQFTIRFAFRSIFLFYFQPRKIRSNGSILVTFIVWNAAGGCLHQIRAKARKCKRKAGRMFIIRTLWFVYYFCF